MKLRYSLGYIPYEFQLHIWMVRQLLNQLRVLVDECKRTFQPMGNEKGNSYWEKELPPNFDRSGTEKFICAKYEGKLWVAKNAKQPVPLLILICEGARAFPQTVIVLLDEWRHDRSPSPSVIVGP